MLADFEPVAVVRYERGIDDHRYLTVDSAWFEGDMAAVHAAFSAKARRYPDNVVPSCVFSMELPAGLWFVDAAANAILPARPTGPCGLQNDPLDALAGLVEASWSSHSTGYSDRFTTESQSRSYTPTFESTTPEDVTAAEERVRSADAMSKKIDPEVRLGRTCAVWPREGVTAPNNDYG